LVRNNDLTSNHKTMSEERLFALSSQELDRSKAEEEPAAS
jgi:hypothetical protein